MKFYWELPQIERCGEAMDNLVLVYICYGISFFCLMAQASISQIVFSKKVKDLEEEIND